MKAIIQFITNYVNSFHKAGCLGKIVLGGVAFMCLCLIPFSILNPSSSSSDNATRSPIASITPDVHTPSPIDTAILTVTQTTAPLPTSTETLIATVALSNTPRPTSTKDVTGILPGLMPVDVTVNLEQRGFTCEPVEQGQLYYLRMCNLKTANYSFHVDIYGRELFIVDYIGTTVLQFSSPDNGLAASLLGFIATMPYDGAVPEEARSWVETTLPTLKGQGDIREKIFAGVTYQLYGLNTALQLEMGTLPDPSVLEIQPTETKIVIPTATYSPSGGNNNCDPSYPTVCIPPPPPDLNCSDIPYTNFKVLPPDPHRFDGDKDGIGCES